MNEYADSNRACGGSNRISVYNGQIPEPVIPGDIGSGYTYVNCMSYYDMVLPVAKPGILIENRLRRYRREPSSRSYQSQRKDYSRRLCRSVRGRPRRHLLGHGLLRGMFLWAIFEYCRRNFERLHVRVPGRAWCK